MKKANVHRDHCRGRGRGHVFAAFAATSAGTPAKVESLTCDVDGGWVMSSILEKTSTANYMPNNGPSGTLYRNHSKAWCGHRHTSNAVIIWDVIAPTSDVAQAP